MANRTTFLFFCSWAKQLSELTRERRCDVYDAIIEYAETGKLPTNLTGEAKMAFTFMKSDVDEMQTKFDDKCEKNRENIRKRWEKYRKAQASELDGNPDKSEVKTTDKSDTTDTTVYDRINRIDSYYEHEHEHEHDSLPNGSEGNINNKKKISPNGDNKKKIPKEFLKPTLEEVRAYIAENGYSVDAELWFSYYESNGWKVGKNPMKAWKSAITTWERKDKQNQRHNENTRTHTENRRGCIDETHPKLEEYDESF
jgi:hypothetical protein